MHGIVPTQTPEEREYHRYLSEVEVRRGRAAELQAELATLNLTLGRFNAEYQARVGSLFVELDGIQLAIDEYERRIAHLQRGEDAAQIERDIAARLGAITDERRQGILASVSERNAGYFEGEMRKLDAWADDRRLSLRRTIKDLEDEIAGFRKRAKQAGNLPDQLAMRRDMTKAEAKRDEAEAEFRVATRQITTQKNDLIDAVKFAWPKTPP